MKKDDTIIKFETFIKKHNLSSDDIAKIMGFKDGLSYQGSSSKKKRQYAAEYFYNLGFQAATKEYEEERKSLEDSIKDRLVQKFKDLLDDE